MRWISALSTGIAYVAWWPRMHIACEPKMNQKWNQNGVPKPVQLIDFTNMQNAEKSFLTDVWTRLT